MQNYNIEQTDINFGMSYDIKTKVWFSFRIKCQNQEFLEDNLSLKTKSFGSF